MSIPKYNEMYREFLDVLSDEQSHHIREIRDSLAVVFGTTEDELNLLLPSGRTPIFSDRVNWTGSYLKAATLVEKPSRGVYRITAEGKKVLSENPPQIDNQFLSRYPSFCKFTSPSSTSVNPTDGAAAKDTESTLTDQTPQDILEEAYQKINSTLAEDILAETMQQSPTFFENLVVKLLTRMGYGGSFEDSGMVTKATGDEGIDGIIREDKLGFSKIYIQAKRWDPKSSVGRPELQKFVGALAGQGATKGLFITTAQFTKEAKEYARKQLATKVVLIDGSALAKLMIEYNVGVSIESTYHIKRIDSDFFSDN